MAKKDRIPPLILFLAGTILLSLAWLMPSFPLLAFVGVSPFIAIAANNRKDKSMWSSLELVLLGITISLYAATIFNKTELAYTIAQAIFFTLPFVGYSFVRKSLGAGVSIFTISLFWLTLEYVFLKWNPAPTVFLADALNLKPEWTRWNKDTGYLGSSLWILISNTFLFQAFLTEKKVSWLFAILFVLSVIGPILYSYTLELAPITKDQMMDLYSNTGVSILGSYSVNGELIPRTSAWVSALALLYTLVKRKTGKK